jgi:hypothetical protein
MVAEPKPAHELDGMSHRKARSIGITAIVLNVAHIGLGVGDRLRRPGEEAGMPALALQQRRIASTRPPVFFRAIIQLTSPQ